MRTGAGLKTGPSICQDSVIRFDGGGVRRRSMTIPATVTSATPASAKSEVANVREWEPVPAAATGTGADGDVGPAEGVAACGAGVEA